jgi:moderate conductance mechanosensitive channel
MIRSSIWRTLVVVACLFLCPALPASAQSSTAPPAQPAPVSADELERLVNTLEDDQGRARLVEQLRALIAAQRGTEEKQSEDSPASFLNNISGQIDAISGEILAAAAVVVDAPRLIAWIEDQVSLPETRSLWLEVGTKLGVIFGAAMLAEWVLRLLLRRSASRLALRSGGSLSMQLMLVLLQFTLEALPIFVFAAVASFILPLVQPRVSTRYTAEVIIHAVLTARLILAGARVLLLSPGAATLYPLGEETRNYLYIWARRLINWAVYGLALAEGTWWLGVPGAIYALILRGTMLVLGGLAVIFVLQNRTAIAEALRGKPGAVSASGQGWRQLRHRLADTWHVAAITYIIGIFGTYVLHIQGGGVFVLRATVLSLVVLLAAGLVVRFVRRASQRGFAIRSDLKLRFPTLETRANRYLPALTMVAAGIVYFFAALALLQAWGVDAFAWFTTTIGKRFAGSLVSIGTVLLIALVLWELFGSAIERYLNSIDSDGRPVARSARARTLLPLLRTAVFILLVTVVTLIVLSELGVNIAPLIAGAGVVGIAVGFGSQALVKDVITGLFILLEDTLAVGEMVDVGKEHVGLVEAITIRTIKLRDNAGTVHTIPFSEVSTVRNMTRDYAYFVADIGVVFREDPDRVVAVLRAVAADLAKDPDWAPYILAPLEVVGVDRFTDSAMVIRIRLKAVPLRQWPVGREFNRRMKKAFDAAGIEMPAANQTRYLPQGEPPEAAASRGAGPVTVAR